MNVDQDTNVQNNAAFGSDYLLGYSFVAGWNFLDNWAAELQTRFTTEKVGNLREYAGNININAKYSLILPGLTSLDTIRFLPYGKIGGGAFGAAIPAASAGNDRQGVWGPAIDFGVGLEMLILKYLYVGLDFTVDIVFMQEKFNSSGQRIMNGGTDIQPSGFGYVGVHF
ncbi:MAG: hypothetical protein Q8P84_05835, partial [Deltaproteobacteria bacterium]|nr:hypothetical protein [Deltaproteobacteria bacterium]